MFFSPQLVLTLPLLVVSFKSSMTELPEGTELKIFRQNFFNPSTVDDYFVRTREGAYTLRRNTTNIRLGSTAYYVDVQRASYSKASPYDVMCILPLPNAYEFSELMFSMDGRVEVLFYVCPSPRTCNGLECTPVAHVLEMGTTRSRTLWTRLQPVLVALVFGVWAVATHMVYTRMSSFAYSASSPSPVHIQHKCIRKRTLKLRKLESKLEFVPDMTPE